LQFLPFIPAKIASIIEGILKLGDSGSQPGVFRAQVVRFAGSPDFFSREFRSMASLRGFGAASRLSSAWCRRSVHLITNQAAAKTKATMGNCWKAGVSQSGRVMGFSADAD